MFPGPVIAQLFTVPISDGNLKLIPSTQLLPQLKVKERLRSIVPTVALAIADALTVEAEQSEALLATLPATTFFHVPSKSR